MNIPAGGLALHTQRDAPGALAFIKAVEQRATASFCSSASLAGGRSTNMFGGNQRFFGKAIMPSEL